MANSQSDTFLEQLTLDLTRRELKCDSEIDIRNLYDSELANVDNVFIYHYTKVGFDSERAKVEPELPNDITPEELQLVNKGIAYSMYYNMLARKIEELNNPASTKIGSAGKYRLGQKRGSKTDMVRIIYALREIGYIVKEDGTIPTIEEFFADCGLFFGDDFRTWSSVMHQFKNTAGDSANRKVFDDMAQIIIDKSAS